MRLLMQTAYTGHPYGTPVSGTESSLAAITADAMRQWHQTQVMHGASVIAIVGAVSPDDAAALAARCFSELRMRSPEAVPEAQWPRGGRAGVESRDKEQTALALAFEGPSRSSEERFAAELLAGVASGLGGRFFEELRDKRSLAYSVHAYPVERSAGGMFVSYIATSPEREDEARDGLLAEFERLRQAPVSVDELERAQEYAVGTYAIRQGSGAAVLGDVIDAWLFGSLDELVSYEARMRAVTAEEMRHVARRWFDPGRVVQGIVRGKPRESKAR
jgi:zinc protease